jgi:hypothetical protein
MASTVARCVAGGECLFAAVAVLVVLINRKAMLSRDGAATHILMLGDEDRREEPTRPDALDAAPVGDRPLWFSHARRLPPGVLGALVRRAPGGPAVADCAHRTMPAGPWNGSWNEIAATGEAVGT